MSCRQPPSRQDLVEWGVDPDEIERILAARQNPRQEAWPQENLRGRSPNREIPDGQNRKGTHMIGLKTAGAVAALTLALSSLVTGSAQAGEGLQVDVFKGRAAIARNISLGEALNQAREVCQLDSSPASNGTLVRNINLQWKDLDVIDRVTVCVPPGTFAAVAFTPVGAFPGDLPE